MGPRRRLSSDGFKLFNLAIMTPPPKHKIRELLSCLFHSPYDDRLAEVTKSCRAASEQLYSYLHYKDIDHSRLIDNAILNTVHAILMNDDNLGTRFNVRRNYQYFMDVAHHAFKSKDHNTAVMIRAALQHHAIRQLKLKERKFDKEFYKKFEQKYGSFRNCYQEHLIEAMNDKDFENYIPSLMVMIMHQNRHKAFSSIGRCKVQYLPYEIQGRVGMLSNLHHYPGPKLSIFEEPPVKNSTELIALAQYIK